MSSLAYLAGVGIEKISGLGGKRGAALKKAGLVSVAHFLLHTPRRYIDRSNIVRLSDTPIGEEVTVIVKVTDVSSRRPRRNLHILNASFTDGESFLSCTWFNQSFRERQLNEGAEVALSGKMELFRGRLQMKSPAVDVLASAKENLLVGRVVPVHSSVGEVGPSHMRRAMHNALTRSRPIDEPFPEDLLDRMDVIDRDQAIANIHFPESMEMMSVARQRLVFDELFRLEVSLAMTKQRRAAEARGIVHTSETTLKERFISSLPYPLTGAQRRVIDEIHHDVTGVHPMHRLLQGEVGSGKTVVAVAALLGVVQGGYQGAMMAPTEVLAAQHYLGISELLSDANMTAPRQSKMGMDSLFAEPVREGPTVTIALLTSSNAELSSLEPGEAKRSDVLSAVAAGEVDIVVGTHSLIQEGVMFHQLGAAVVDEQHRFGVHQRVALKEKAGMYDPDMLIMTATPIPRTLSMTLYGDLDVSVLDEMPPGRTPVVTSSLGSSPAELDKVYALVRDEIAEGRQAFLVCPLVDDSDKIEAASATAEHQRLSRLFPDLNVGLLHGQMKPAEKDAVMHQMRDGEIDLLVATTVIEVGIDIPNATVMVIQDANRFGLSQLHQLRGRVGRGKHASHCVLVADPGTEEGNERLAAMVETSDGFLLAEEDLRIRGQGTIFGARQSGMADLRLADILRDMDVLIEARNEAFALVERDPMLVEHPLIADEVREMLGEAVEWLFKS